MPTAHSNCLQIDRLRLQADFRHQFFEQAAQMVVHRLPTELQALTIPDEVDDFAVKLLGGLHVASQILLGCRQVNFFFLHDLDEEVRTEHVNEHVAE